MTLYFTSSYGKIAYTDTKDGATTLVMMHGLATSKELFSPVLNYLNQGYRIITFDLNGYGQSDKLQKLMPHRARAKVLDELRMHLQLKKFNLIAHDLGASVAIDYMGRYADYVQKLVLISPPVYPEFQEPFMIKLLRTPWLGEQLVLLLKNQLYSFGIKSGMVHKNKLTPQLLDAFAGPFKSKKDRAALMLALRWGEPHLVFKNYPQIIKEITIPTLILQGRYDPYIPEEQATHLKEDIKDSRLVFIEEGSHFLPIDTPDKVASEINNFIPVGLDPRGLRKSLRNW